MKLYETEVTLLLELLNRAKSETDNLIKSYESEADVPEELWQRSVDIDDLIVEVEGSDSR